MSKNTVIPRPEHPRPLMYRPDWINLNGEWSFEFDFGKSGLERGLQESKGFERKITVPFCPESELSGVNHKDFIESMFYHRKIGIPESWRGKLVILHFGAVDYECDVYIDGKFVGSHTGGSVSFEFDITEYVADKQEHDLVLRVNDRMREQVQSLGKQSSGFHSAGCSYTRVTGIWQTVWLEAVGPGGLRRCKVTPDLDNSSFIFMPEFYGEQKDKKLDISIRKEGALIAGASIKANSGTAAVIRLDNPHPWSPKDPYLYEIVYEVFDGKGGIVDRTESYAGLRKIHTEGDKIFLNNQEIFLRLVLDQGYYPDGIWTAPDDQSLKRDIELSMAAGFNGARLHQKVFEERFHYWADRLGYLTWGESASWGLFCFSGNISGDSLPFWKSAFNFLSEWKEIILRDYNHPSIIAWTPSNETWSVSDVPLYRRLITEIYDATKALDPGRPVNDCSGYHHIKTDLWTVHIYRSNAEELAKSLEKKESQAVVTENQKRCGCEYGGQPYLNDEFGGFMFIPPDRQKFAENTWGYYGLDLKNEDELCRKIEEQVDVMLDTPELSGYCYTQLTDVEQEQNGLYNYDRTPKVSDGKLAKIFGKTPKRLKD